MKYLEALSIAHSVLKPRFYMEIGCRHGISLALAQCPSIGVDPDFEITAELRSPTRLFKQASDAFFSRSDLRRVLDGKPDLSFIDGMHRIEFALRDFVNLERISSDRAVILIDDVVPGDMSWTTHERQGQFWTGDVYRLIPLLRERRPDLAIEVFDIEVKGLAVISALRPSDGRLLAALPEIEREIDAGSWSMESVEDIRRSLVPRPVSELRPHLERIAEEFPSRPFESSIRGPFLKHYQAGTLRYSYRGRRCIKSPIDLAIYLKLIWDLKPRTIIEVGSKEGGSALFWADIARIYGLGCHVYSLDLEPPDLDDKAAITFARGDVHELGATFDELDLWRAPRPWLVTEDSAHTFRGCLAALRFLATALQRDDVLVMEDGNVAELGLADRYDGGPSRAIATFMDEQPGAFAIMTEYCDMFGPNATYNPNGYLRRI
jgi:cephalosporin hydroxylase